MRLHSMLYIRCVTGSPITINMAILCRRRQASGGGATPPIDAWGGTYPPASHGAAVGGALGGGGSPQGAQTPRARAALRRAAAPVDPHSIEACENLLENYFMQARPGAAAQALRGHCTRVQALLRASRASRV